MLLNANLLFPLPPSPCCQSPHSRSDLHLSAPGALPLQGPSPALCTSRIHRIHNRNRAAKSLLFQQAERKRLKPFEYWIAMVKLPAAFFDGTQSPLPWLPATIWPPVVMCWVFILPCSLRKNHSSSLAALFSAPLLCDCGKFLSRYSFSRETWSFYLSNTLLPWTLLQENYDFVEKFLLLWAKWEIIFVSTLDEINYNLDDGHLPWPFSSKCSIEFGTALFWKYYFWLSEVIDSETCTSLF